MTLTAPLAVLLTLAAFVGQACILMATVNFLYGERISKSILKPVRLLFGAMILGIPALLVLIEGTQAHWFVPRGIQRDFGNLVQGLLGVYLYFGIVVFPAITLVRLFKPRPRALLKEQTETLKLWQKHGDLLRGNSHWRWATFLPCNQVFRVDFTEMEIQVPRLPLAWDGLTIHLVSDLHFIGTPSPLYYEELVAQINRWPTPDLLLLAGDYVDSVPHHQWISQLLAPLKWKDAAYAILGNHDAHFQPDTVRSILNDLGCTVLGNNWQEATIRGEQCVVVGHEGPWFRPPTDLSQAPPELFKLCLSHSPDNYPWAVRSGVDFMVCGHVHGGQVRLPLIGSIFVPSVYGRRYDMGVFEQKNTVMVVNRGASGKEPIRFRCNAQVMRITLRPLALT